MRVNDPIVRMHAMLGEMLTPETFKGLWQDARDELADARPADRCAAARRTSMSRTAPRMRVTGSRR
jgi:hypothetical protein